MRDSNRGVLRTILGRREEQYELEYSVVCRGFEKDNDVAILQIDARQLSNAGKRFMGSTARLFRIRMTGLQSGESVTICGCPMSLKTPILTFGIVSASPVDERGRILVSASIQPGNSGGPCYDSRGKVVGLVSSTHTFGMVEAYTDRGKILETIPRNYGEIVPIQLLRDLAATEEVPVDFGEGAESD